MKFSSNTVARLASAGVIVLATALPGPASAETRSAHGEWVNSNVVVWKNPFGQCWQGRHWIPAASGEDCAAEAPLKQPAMLLVQVDREPRSAVVRDATGGDAAEGSSYARGEVDAGKSRVTSCFTNHN